MTRLTAHQVLYVVSLVVICLLLFYSITPATKLKDFFPGEHYRSKSTLSVELLGSSRFGRCERHVVRTETGKIIDDWLWFDEVSAVNVVVITEDGEYVMFRQRHYGMPEPHLCLLGGIVEVGEDPLLTAQRELLEELGLETNMWMDLGTYRVAANRGAGFLSCFVAQRVREVAPERRVRDQDYEKRSVLRMSREEAVRRLFDGELGEIKWSGCLAMALLASDGHNSQTSP